MLEYEHIVTQNKNNTDIKYSIAVNSIIATTENKTYNFVQLIEYLHITTL